MAFCLILPIKIFIDNRQNTHISPTMFEQTDSTPLKNADINDAAQPLLTIVVPVYNRATLVGRTLDSIAAQTLRPLSVILVDNASTDASKAVLHDWMARNNGQNGLSISLLDESSVGACAARNRGLEMVKTPWVMFFDSDDIMLPQHCERAINAAAAHPNKDIIGWDVLYGKDGGEWKRLTFCTKDLLYNNLFNSCFATQRYMCRTELMRAIGGWNTDVVVWNDIELGTRLALRKPKCFKIRSKEPTVKIYITDESITGGSFGARPIEKFDTLKLIQRYVPDEWIFLKEVILSAHCQLCKTADGRILLEGVVFQEKKKWRKKVLRFAYKYTLRGGRGIARIVRPLMPRR